MTIVILLRPEMGLELRRVGDPADFEGVEQTGHGVDPGAALAELEGAHVADGHFSLERKVLLRYPGALAQVPDRLPEGAHHPGARGRKHNNKLPRLWLNNATLSKALLYIAGGER